jgi:hypothetical protein
MTRDGHGPPAGGPAGGGPAGGGPVGGGSFPDEVDERTLATIVALARPAELPILDEIAASLEARTRDALGQAGGESNPRHTARRRRARRGTAGRIARRSAVTTGLLCMVAASALGARSLLKEHRAGPTTAPATLVQSGHGDRRQQLSVYRHDGALCVALESGGTLGSRCDRPPAAASMQLLSVHGPHDRLVSGLAGARVARVRVVVDGRSLTLATHPLPSSDRDPDAHLPSGLRWFLLSRPAAGTVAQEPPARVAPLNTNGEPLGRTQLDCTLGTRAAACAVSRRP